MWGGRDREGVSVAAAVTVSPRSARAPRRQASARSAQGSAFEGRSSSRSTRVQQAERHALVSGGSCSARRHPVPSRRCPLRTCLRRRRYTDCRSFSRSRYVPCKRCQIDVSLPGGEGKKEMKLGEAMNACHGVACRAGTPPPHTHTPHTHHAHTALATHLLNESKLLGLHGGIKQVQVSRPHALHQGLILLQPVLAHQFG